MRLALITIGVLSIAATVLPFSRKDSWWIRSLDFPRVQIAIVLAVVLVTYWLWIDRAGAADNLFVAALAASLLYHAYMTYPYLPFSRKQVQWSRHPRKESSVSLLTVNVLMTNRKAAQLTKIVREADPDIILVVEPDEWWKDQLTDFARTHPYTVYQPQDNTYGMLLYSRLPLIDPEVRFLIQQDIPSIHARIKLRAALEVELHCLHPRPPFPTEEDDSAERDAELLIVGAELKKKNGPAIVMGDLNDVAWSRTNYLFQNISGLLDPRIGRGSYNTFHAKYFFMRFPLDHFFVSRHFRLVAFMRLSYFGSDHFPVFIAINYEPDSARQQEGLHADRSERRKAEEKIAKAGHVAGGLSRPE